MIYGQTMIEPTNSTVTRRQRFRQFSEDWHWFLGFTSSIRTRALGKRTRNPFEDDGEENWIQRRYHLANAPIFPLFQKMVGRPEMAFRGVQEPALRAIQ